MTRPLSEIARRIADRWIPPPGHFAFQVRGPAEAAGLRAAPMFDDPALPVGLEFWRGALEAIYVTVSDAPFSVWTPRHDFGIIDRFVAATPSDPDEGVLAGLAPHPGNSRQ